MSTRTDQMDNTESTSPPTESLEKKWLEREAQLLESINHSMTYYSRAAKLAGNL
jgi:hypothetical protein